MIGRLTFTVAAMSRELPREMSRVKQQGNIMAAELQAGSSAISSSLQLFGTRISLPFPRRYGSPTAFSPLMHALSHTALPNSHFRICTSSAFLAAAVATELAAVHRRIRDHANTTAAATAARQLLKNLTPAVNRSLGLFLRSCEASHVADVIYVASSFVIYLAHLAAKCESHPLATTTATTTSSDISLGTLQVE